MPDEFTTSPCASAPVRYIPSDYAAPPPKPGIGLCLSGGGYRAMIFHLGSLIRLNEAGILKRLNRISSVSGGSITAGVLGMKWKTLQFQNDVAENFQEVIAPIKAVAGTTIDVGAVLEGLVLPGTISQKVERVYNNILFKDKTLQDLPSDHEGPRFVINATNVESGVLFRFSKPFMADYRVGMIMSPGVSLAKAVAASSAFPPVLSPSILEVNPHDFKPDPSCPLQKEPFTSRIALSDGGVYDNLGLETVWKEYQTVLVCDAGAGLKPDENPKRDWIFHAVRILEVINNQVGALRKRQVIESFKRNDDVHDGAYFGIRSHVKDYHPARRN